MIIWRPASWQARVWWIHPGEGLRPPRYLCGWSYFRVLSLITGVHAEVPAALKAATRRKYFVFGVRPVKGQEVTSAPTVNCWKLRVKPVLVAIWTVKPVSLFELSFQFNVREVAVLPEVSGLEGATGMVGKPVRVVTCTVLDGRELPTMLKAKTRYE